MFHGKWTCELYWRFHHIHVDSASKKVIMIMLWYTTIQSLTLIWRQDLYPIYICPKAHHTLTGLSRLTWWQLRFCLGAIFPMRDDLFYFYFFWRLCSSNVEKSYGSHRMCSRKRFRGKHIFKITLPNKLLVLSLLAFGPSGIKKVMVYKYMLISLSECRAILSLDERQRVTECFCQNGLQTLLV